MRRCCKILNNALSAIDDDVSQRPKLFPAMTMLLPVVAKRLGVTEVIDGGS